MGGGGGTLDNVNIGSLELRWPLPPKPLPVPFRLMAAQIGQEPSVSVLRQQGGTESEVPALHHRVTMSSSLNDQRGLVPLWAPSPNAELLSLYRQRAPVLLSLPSDPCWRGGEDGPQTPALGCSPPSSSDTHDGKTPSNSERQSCQDRGSQPSSHRCPLI